MKKIILALLLLYSIPSFSQTFIKYNIPLTVIGAVNPSIETRLTNRWTLDYSVLMTFRNETATKGPFRIFMMQPEARYYLKESFNGFFAGINTGYAMYRMTKPGWVGDGSGEEYKREHIYQVGWSIQAGITLGYQYHFCDKWMAEIFIGGGRQWSNYEAFYFPNGGRYVGFNGSAEWLPYKGGINIGYRLGK